MAFEKQEIIDRVIERCIRDRWWLSSCQDELSSYAGKSERKAIALYAKERYDAAGAGHSGRWQG